MTTPSLTTRLRDTFAYFNAKVGPAAHAAFAAAFAATAFAADAGNAAFAAASSAANAAGDVANAVGDVVKAVNAAASSAADAAVYAAAAAAKGMQPSETVGKAAAKAAPKGIWPSETAGKAAVKAANAARKAAKAVEKAAAGRIGDALVAVRRAADAAVLALEECERVFSELASSESISETAISVRRPGRTVVRLVDLAAMALPMAARARYTEEWISLLSELPTRRARAQHVCSILYGAPNQSYTLRRPIKEIPPA